MSVTHRSISVAVEGSFGSLVNGLPSYSGLSFTSIPCERDPIIIYGEVVASERNDARDGTYSLPPEPDTVWSSGYRVRRRTGQVVIRLDLTTTSAANYSANYLGQLLGGGFHTAYTGGWYDTVAAAVDVNTFTPTAANTQYVSGSLLGINIDGRAEYSAVTSPNSSGDVVVSPAFSALAGGEGVHLMQTWYPPQRSDLGEVQHSLAFRVDGVDFRSYAYGCKLETLALSLDNGRVMADLTYQAAIIQDDHDNAAGPVEPVYNSGAPCFFRGSYVVVSDAAPTSLTDGGPDALGRIQLDCEDFTLTVTNTLTPIGHSDSILAMRDMEVSDCDVELSLTVSTPNTTLNSDYFNRQLRQVLVGFGPLNLGKGGAFQIPAAYLTADPSKYDVSGNDIVRQSLTYKCSRFGGDSQDGHTAYRTPFRLALGKGS